MKFWLLFSYIRKQLSQFVQNVVESIQIQVVFVILHVSVPEPHLQALLVLCAGCFMYAFKIGFYNETMSYYL